MHTLRRRALWILVGTGFTVLGVASVTALPVWPVVGVAVAAVALVLNTMTSRLQATSCLGCAGDLSGQPVSARGRMCPSCGTINERPLPGFDEKFADAASVDGDRPSNT